MVLDRRGDVCREPHCMPRDRMQNFIANFSHWQYFLILASH
jgi:hypothetical protein